MNADELGGLGPDAYLKAGGMLTLPASRPAAPAAGTLFFDAAKGFLEVHDGLGWLPAQAPKSCAQLKAMVPARGDGLYWIQPHGNGPAVKTYCDMTTDGGGWTLVSYGFRAADAAAGAIFQQPVSFTAGWDAGARNNIAAIDGRELLRSAGAAMLTITSGAGAAVIGNGSAYLQVYVWPTNGAVLGTFDLTDQSSCVTMNVRELKSSTSWTAYSQVNRIQVSCSGNKAGTAYERTFMGFNKSACYGVCGSDDAQSNGMVVWGGSNYNPSTSGATGKAERAGSFALWLR